MPLDILRTEPLLSDLADPSTARYLPPEAYFSPEWEMAEAELLFERSWALVTSTDELGGPGTAMRVQVGRKVLMVTVGPAGELSAHQAGTVSSPAAIAVWEGMVFVNLEPATPSLLDTLGEWPAHIGSHRPSLLTQVAHCRIDGAFNWKLFVENHIDIYHLWYLHDRTLGDFDHPHFEHTRLGPNWVSYEPLRADSPLRPLGSETGRPIRHLGERDRVGIGAHMIFPNILCASTADFFATYAVYPNGADHAFVDLRIRADADADGAALVEAARRFINEDVAACEGVQAAVRSRLFSVGPLATSHEHTIALFHADLREHLHA